MKKNLYIFWDRKSTPKLDEFKVERNFAYSDSRVVDSMDVVPLVKPASMPMFPIEEWAIERKKKYAYFLFRGRIYYGECVDTGGLVFDNLEEVKTEGGEPLKVDNFFVFKDKVWFATRFELKIGSLDFSGKIVRDITIVQGIPKCTEAEYYHILRCCVGEVDSYYKMFTEEVLMKKEGVGLAGRNYHSQICEYRSTDLLTWQFREVLYQDDEDYPYEQKIGKDGFRRKHTKLQEMKMFRRYDFTEVEIEDLTKPLQENIETYWMDFVSIDKKFRAYIWRNEIANCYQSDEGTSWKSIGIMSFLDKPWMSVRFLCWGS